MASKEYIAAIFASSFLLCILPQFLKKMKFIKRIYPYITVFVAGFMLAIMLLDFIPHIFGECSHSHSKNNTNTEHAHEEGHHEDGHHSHSHSHTHNENCSHASDKAFNTKVALLTTGIAFIFLIGIDSLVLNHSHCDNKEAIHDHSKHDHDSFGTCNTEALKYSTSFAQALILVFALSIHSLFEGLGMENKSSAFEMAMFVHKVVESFTLGVAIASSRALKARYAIGLSLFYSILTPLGIIAIKNYNAIQSIHDNVIGSICNGLALGSTMFIVCIEMIPPMFHSKGTFKEDAYKIIGLLLGFVITGSVISLFNRIDDNNAKK